MLTVSFSGHEIRVLDRTPHGLLLNTVDVCSILGITDRQSGTDLGQPCLDLVTAMNLALGRNHAFVEWLIETFNGHPVETLVRPTCDYDWSNRPT
jgi:prophage antirepressor-like protein